LNIFEITNSKKLATFRPGKVHVAATEASKDTPHPNIPGE